MLDIAIILARIGLRNPERNLRPNSKMTNDIHVLMWVS